jgi:hypothetical protein
MLRIFQAIANRASADRAVQDRACMNADVIPIRGSNPYGVAGIKGDTAEAMSEDIRKTRTRGVLHRALGSSADVLPIKPND